MKLRKLYEAPVNKWPFYKRAAIVGAAGTALSMPYIINTSEERPGESIAIAKEKILPVVEKPLQKHHITSDIEAMRFIEPHEGRRSKVYLDTKGIPTVGIGFNLRRSDAGPKLKALGRDIKKIMSGQELTNQEIDQLFKSDVRSAIAHANAFTDLSKHPKDVQLVLVDMAFNLGPEKLAQFRNFRMALNVKDYKKASKEMINSSWYHQVGNRSKKLVNIMMNVDSI